MRRLIPYAITLSLATLAAWGCNGSSQNTLTTPGLDSNTPGPSSDNELTPPTAGNTSDEDDPANRPAAGNGPGGGNDPGGGPGSGSGGPGPTPPGSGAGQPPPGPPSSGANDPPPANGSGPGGLGRPEPGSNTPIVRSVVTTNCDGEQISFEAGARRFFTLPRYADARDEATFAPNVFVNENEVTTALTASIALTPAGLNTDAWIFTTSGRVGLDLYTSTIAFAIQKDAGCVAITSAQFAQTGGQDPADLATSWLLENPLAVAANPYDYEVGESNVVEVRRPVYVPGNGLAEFVTWTWTIAEEWVAPGGATFTRIEFTHETVFGDQANFSLVWSTENGIVALEDPFFYPIDGEGTGFLYTFEGYEPPAT